MLSRTLTVRCAILALSAIAVIAVACGGSSGDDGKGAGAPRAFALGFSALPRELNAEAYQEAIEFAADHGEVVLIQKTVPWASFLPGAQPDEQLAQNVAAERQIVRDHDLHLFFAIDPTDGASGRDRLADLPAAMQGRGFNDPDVRAAFLGYARYVALNYKPDYLALGVEMNLYYRKNPDDFASYRTLYDEAFAVVKEASPGTQITVTLQYEDLQGILPRDDAHFADWQLVYAFEPNIDFIGVSTYPSFAYADAAAMPANYYTKLRGFTERPIAFAEAGFSSATGQENINSGTEEQQAAFVERLLREAEDLDAPFAVWFAIWDPSYARDSTFAAFQHIGLLRSDGTEKPAWARWIEAAHRPYDEVPE